MLRTMMILVLGLVLLGSGFAGQASASSGFSISVGTDDFYLSVGNYDYYPYTLPYYNRTPRISFHSVMADYGTWVSLAPFGQVWRPYVHSRWRPYVQGHWTYTRYGPTWVGYEPWAWAGYHYGNWIFSSRFGWVWIPGYDWHPGRVIWSHGYDTIGWMPAPPYGYDYSRGYLDYRGSHGQFDYYDDDFGYYDDDYYGDRYGSGYRNPFFDSGYRNIVVNLWVFIDVNHYRHHNYADYYLDSDYTRTLFDRRLVRISSRPIERRTLERIVKQKVNEVSVQEREIETNNRRVKVVVPSGEEENIRRNANRVVKKMIAPAFAEKKRDFKGLQSENTKVVNRVFKQENKQPNVRKQTVEDVLREIEKEDVQVERQRKNLVREKTDKVIRNHEAAKAREKRPEQKPKENRSVNREEQFKPVPERKQNVDQLDSKRIPNSNRKEELESRSNKQLPKEFETRREPAKQNDRDVESKSNPLPGNRNVERNAQFEREKQQDRLSEKADPRVESDRNANKEKETLKQKGSEEKDEKVTTEKEEKGKSKQKKDLKKKNQEQQDR